MPFFKTHRICAYPGKSYYHSREIGYTGIIDRVVTSVPATLAMVIVKQLGGKMSLTPSRGCNNIKKRQPKKRTTLGLVIEESFYYCSLPDSP